MYTPKGMRAGIRTHTGPPMFTAALATIVTPPGVHQQTEDEQNGVYRHNGIGINHKKG